MELCGSTGLSRRRTPMYAGDQRRAMTDPSRIDTIEIKLAHLERALMELGATVTRQQRDIEVLVTLNRQLRQQLETYGAADATSPDAHERPPHY